jgi:hypothetical protein
MQITAITGILILAALTEALVEYLIAPLADNLTPPEQDHWRELGMRYIATMVAIALCFTYRADLFALLGIVSAWPWVGYLLTGLIIGRGANWVHDFAGRWLSPTQ